MIKRVFGRPGLSVSALGLGCNKRRQPMRPARSARRAVTAWIMMAQFMRGGTPK